MAIAERCQVEIELGRVHLLPFLLPDGQDPASYPEQETSRSREAFREVTPEIKCALTMSFGIINSMGYPGYFLTSLISSIMPAPGIQVGPGRGSEAASSLAAYCLMITDINPPVRAHLRTLPQS